MRAVRLYSPRKEEDGKFGEKFPTDSCRNFACQLLSNYVPLMESGKFNQKLAARVAGETLRATSSSNYALLIESEKIPTRITWYNCATSLSNYILLTESGKFNKKNF